MPIKDTIDGFEISDEQLKRFGNERNAIEALWTGLQFLNGELAKIEPAKVDEAAGFKMMAFGNIPGVPPGAMKLIGCWFRWYAVSAVDFVRLIGQVHHDINSSAPSARDYAKAVLPHVSPFRDKVAAHAARHSNPRNAAEACLSVIPNVTQTHKGFICGGLSFTRRRQGH